MIGILQQHRGFLDRRMAAEICPNQPAVPRPGIFGVARRVNADVPATGTDISFEGGLLRRIQNVARGREENHCRKLGEVSVIKVAAVFGGNDLEAVVGTELPDRFNTVGDRRMPECRGLGKYQHFESRAGRGTGAHNEREGKKRDKKVLPPLYWRASHLAWFLRLHFVILGMPQRSISKLISVLSAVA